MKCEHGYSSAIEMHIAIANNMLNLKGSDIKQTEIYLQDQLIGCIKKYDKDLNNYYLKNGEIFFFNETIGQWNLIKGV